MGRTLLAKPSRLGKRREVPLSMSSEVGVCGHVLGHVDSSRGLLVGPSALSAA